MIQKATFAAGCFWHVEAAFRQIKGVVSTKVGYTGGTMKSPSYEDVCTGKTLHAEAVEVAYDTGIISYEELLKVFWETHDPSQLNRQGRDVGTQYRSAIFYHNEDQKAAAIKSREKEQKRHKSRIVTEIKPAKEFYLAEEYHQKYLEKRGASTCNIR